MAQTQGSTTTRYVQDLAAPLAQILSDGTQHYVYGNPAERLFGIVTTIRSWYNTDALGSVRAILSDSGTVQVTTSYDAWGVPQSSAIAPFGFTGELQSGSDVWLRARWYGAGRGGFGARDAWQGNAQTPYSMQYYQYGYSNPVSWTDPTGQAVKTGTEQDMLCSTAQYIECLVAYYFSIPALGPDLQLLDQFFNAHPHDTWTYGQRDPEGTALTAAIYQYIVTHRQQFPALSPDTASGISFQLRSAIGNWLPVYAADYNVPFDTSAAAMMGAASVGLIADDCFNRFDTVRPGAPALKGDEYHPDTVAGRQRDAQNHYGPQVSSTSPRPHLNHPARELPIEGERPYVAPKRPGNPQEVRASQGEGFIDVDGNRWTWAKDQHGGPHWDVQHKNGSHTNVFPDGSTLGTDNFPNRRR